jgi:hypothetical protein
MPLVRRTPRRIPVALLAALACSMLLAGTAHAASTFAVEVRPSTAGTAAAPVPVTISIRASLSADGPGGVPPSLRGIAIAMPDGWATALGGTTSCVRADLEARGSSACPATSKLGGGSAQFTVNLGGFPIPAETAEVGLYRGVGGELLLYLRVASPAPFSVVLPGTLIARPAPAGPLVTFDLSRTAQLSGGISITVTNAVFDVTRGLAAGPCPWRFTARLVYAAGTPDDRTAEAPCMSGPDTTRPTLSASARNGTPALGARFTVRVSEPATVRITLQRRAGTRWVQVRRISSRVASGTSRLRIRRVSGRALRAGRYRARIQATDAAGLKSPTRTVTFTLRRAR